MNVKQLKSVIDNANELFTKLKKKYSRLDGYLVFSSPYGQCGLTTNPTDILQSFPQMIFDSEHKTKGLQLLHKINDIEAGYKQTVTNLKFVEKLKQQMDEIVKNMEVNEDTFVEIRFKGTDLDLIFEIQKDELISQEYTPQTKASIRIVLGAIRDLLKT